MSKFEPINDPVLGLLEWNAESSQWKTQLQLPTGALFECSIHPDDHRIPLQLQGLEQIRSTIQWLRNNEPELRGRIAAAMFDWWLEGWYDEEIDTVTSKQEFAETISLAAVDVYEDLKHHVHYDDGDMIGGHGIILTIDSNGTITDGPNIWG